MAGFKELLGQYKVKRNECVNDNRDFTLVLLAADRKANRALFVYGNRNDSLDSIFRRSCYLRALNEISGALDIIHFSRFKYNTDLIDNYLKGK